MSFRIVTGDCLRVMAEMDAESIDAIVTDPPYGLSFMGKDWDHGIPGAHFWQEAIRVAKPGAHLLAFGGTRTFHRLTCAIEDAGWEIRDCIMWVYGSGFPKSLDVSKAIDKSKRRDFVLAAQRLGLTIPSNNLHDWTKAEHSPGDKWWNMFKSHLTKEQWGSIEREVVGQRNGKLSGWSMDGGGAYVDRDITSPATDAARQWQGWGTALKPAWEPIIVARKPLAGTVAENVLKHGTGAMNIDACRIEMADDDRAVVDSRSGAGKSTEGWGHIGNRPEDARYTSNPAGRWPANVIHDGSEEVLRLMPENAGGGFVKPYKRASHDNYSGGWPDAFGGGHDNGGTAARFFYAAKADRAEREIGVDRNHHPTVKPVDLMQYLVRLVAPKGATVLDPFAGSGSTGIAALRESCNFVGIELSPEYAEIARARIKGDAPLINLEG